MICAVAQSTTGICCRLDINPLMARHRIEHEPRHRAPRPDRRVRLSGASPRTPSHAKPSTAPGQLGKACEAIGSGASERLHTAGIRLRKEQRVLLTGAARGLIVSPWFAAGAGFVIAAGAFMYAPHASVNFDTAPGRTLCPTPGCPVPQKEPQIAGGTSGLVTASPLPTSSSPRGRHAAHHKSDSAPSFTYTVQADGTGMYQMILTETSEHAIGGWRLSVVIPGAEKVSVYDGMLQGSGTDGAIAGGAAGSGGPPGTSAGVLTESGYDPTNILHVVVDGDGSVKTAPADYVFRDAQGSFSQH
jgi:hypothetical protein